jgi:hypothetical protein
MRHTIKELKSIREKKHNSHFEQIEFDNYIDELMSIIVDCDKEIIDIDTALKKIRNRIEIWSERSFLHDEFNPECPDLDQCFCDASRIISKYPYVCALTISETVESWSES